MNPVLKISETTLKQLLAANKTAYSADKNYINIDNIIYRAIINSIWVSRDIPLKRYAIAAAEIDESIYNAVTAALLCSNHEVTPHGEIALYKTVATSEFNSLDELLNSFIEISVDEENQFYPFQKDANYQTTLEEITGKFQKTQKIVADTEELF